MPRAAYQFFRFCPQTWAEEKPFMTLGSNWPSSLVVGRVENADIVVVSGVTVTATKSESRVPWKRVKSSPYRWGMLRADGC